MTGPGRLGQAPAPRDEGSAMLMVLAMMSVLLLVVSGALTFAQQTQGVAMRSRDYNQALAAARAGVDDYVARLNANDLYWRSVDCSNDALKRAFTGTVPCGWGAGTATGWLTVPSSRTTAYPAQFHYDVDISQTQASGKITVVSTGRARSLTRSISVTLQRKGFGEYLYLTEYETIDPANRVVFPNATTANRAATECRRHFYASPGRTSICRDLNFVEGDVINGPLHTNDAMLIMGRPRYVGAATTSYPSCEPGLDGVARPVASCYRAGAGANPDFQRGLTWTKPVVIPETIGDLRPYVTQGSTDNLGCLYTGPTRIKFLPPGGGPAQMTVWSKWTQTNAGRNTACGTTAALTSVAGATVAVPDGKLIFVQDVPSTQTAPASGSCPVNSIGDSLPQSGDGNRTSGEYNCRYGTAYVQGTLAGRTTIAADNNVVITDNLVYAGGRTGDDALGLIAANSVVLYHPVDSANANLPRPWGGTFDNPTVYASILALQHSFGVQYYDRGATLGTITLHGSITQRFRGPVGTVNSGALVSGYLKNYEHDPRLRYSPPPYFLPPVQSAWGPRTFGEVAPRYRTP